MSGAGGARLVVQADLRVQVVDPRGRAATVVVDDHDGALRVRVGGAADLPVLLGSIPRLPGRDVGLGPVLSGFASVPGRDGLRWDQDVEVVLGRRLLLRRASGRWRPTPTAVVPVALAGVSVLAAAGAVVAVVVGIVGRFVARRRDGGGASG